MLLDRLKSSFNSKHIPVDISRTFYPTLWIQHSAHRQTISTQIQDFKPSQETNSMKLDRLYQEHHPSFPLDSIAKINNFFTTSTWNRSRFTQILMVSTDFQINITKWRWVLHFAGTICNANISKLDFIIKLLKRIRRRVQEIEWQKCVQIIHSIWPQSAHSQMYTAVSTRRKHAKQSGHFLTNAIKYSWIQLIVEYDVLITRDK